MTRNTTRNIELFGSRLKAAQAEKEMTNEAAAAAIGVSLRLYQMWRSGKRPSLNNLLLVARFYEKPVGWFLGDEEITTERQRMSA